MRMIKLISLARYARLWTADEHSLTLDIARPRPQPSSALKRKKKFILRSMPTSTGRAAGAGAAVIVDVDAVAGVPGEPALMARSSK